MKSHKILALALLISLLLTACAPKASASSSQDLDGLKMASMTGMPADVIQSAKSVQIAYQFAVANPDVLKNIPCYCGCGAAGHKSNYACYVKDDTGGQITYDLHATGCSICVDITRDTMRMMQEGKSIPEIKTAIDQTYSKFGPSNMK
jgi:hypothetical protein